MCYQYRKEALNDLGNGKYESWECQRLDKNFFPNKQISSFLSYHLLQICVSREKTCAEDLNPRFICYVKHY